MATVTLTGNTNYSALSLANDDTIDCAGFTLTLDIQPTHTGIQVTSPGTGGIASFSGAWVIPTWDFFAGAGPMIGTLSFGAEIKSITGGTSNNAYGINNNRGVVWSSIGGSGTGARGITNNFYLVGLAIGGPTAGARGVAVNNGTVISSVGGSDVGAPGITTNSGQCLRLEDNVGMAVDIWNGSTCFVEGPHVNGTIPDNIKTIYSLGTLSGGATIAGDATVITLSEGGGGSVPARIRQGNLLGRSF